MDRDALVTLCEGYAGRGQVLAGRVPAATFEPVAEILESFRHAEISESEKNALLALVLGPEAEDGCADEEVCILDPYADECAATGDDD